MQALQIRFACLLSFAGLMALGPACSSADNAASSSGRKTCADLRPCCERVTEPTKTACNAAVSAKNDSACASSFAQMCGGGDAGASPASACDALQKLCDSCSDSTLKQACFTSVVTYRNGGDAGLGGCQAVLDSKTYDPESTACAKPKSSCEMLGDKSERCGNDKQKALCTSIAKAGDDAKCQMASSLCEPYVPAGGPSYPGSGSPCCDVGRPPDMDNQCSIQ